MAGRVELARDLRLGLAALEGGAIDPESLRAALRAWTLAPDRSLAEVLEDQGALGPTDRDRRDDPSTKDQEPPGAGAEPGRSTGSGDSEPTVTFASAARTPGAEAGPFAGNQPGDRGGGRRFRVLRPHARGGLGEVFLAFDDELNRQVALKELQARRADDPDARARFVREAEVTGALEHPGIVPVYSLGRHPDGRPYYAMRLIEGETLRDAIERFHRPGPAAIAPEDRELAFRRLLRSLIEACNAVAFAHSRDVVHRDLKPENIMLGPFGETLVVDWGIAKALRDREDVVPEPESEARDPADPAMTRPGSLLGTPRYMSPEQAAGDLPRVGPASDIYSLGAILYALLVGHAPFVDSDVAKVLDRARRGIFPAPRRLRKAVDPTLEAICLKAMAREPSDRHATALDLAHDLEAWQADVRYRGEQERALGQVKASLTRLCLERGRQCFDREATAEGMLRLARALEHAPTEPPELVRVIRTSLGGWHARAKLLERTVRHGGEVRALAFCPQGRRLATAGADRTARLWDLSTGSPLTPPLRHDGAVLAVAFHPDGAMLATAGDDGKVRRWDALTGAPLGQPFPTAGRVASLGFSPDGARLAAAGLDGFCLWDAATGEVVSEPEGAPGKVLGFAFSRDGALLALAAEDGGIRLMETATGRAIGEPLAQGAAVTALAFDPGGHRLLAGGRDGSARLWDVDERSVVVSLSHPGVVHCVGYRPGGATFATASEHGTARLWDAATGRPIGEPLAHRSGVDGLAFRPDGTILATWSPDGTARLWCAASGLPIGPPLTHGGSARALDFSPDGRRLATGGPDATARCWSVPDPVEGVVERVCCWVRVTTELEFDAGDAIRRMDGPTIWDLRRHLTELGGPPIR